MKVTVVSVCRDIGARELELIEPATVADALAAADVHSELASGKAAAVGIWGRVVDVGSPVCDGDRVELYPPLKQDPRQERQRRAIRGTTMGTGQPSRDR